MIGFDTGFFLALLRGRATALEVWRTVAESDEPKPVGCVSCLTLFELERLGLKGAVKAWKEVTQAISDVCRVVWLEHTTLSLAARLSHGTGLPAMDAMILAGLLDAGAETVYITDEHFRLYTSKGVRIELIRP